MAYPTVSRFFRLAQRNAYGRSVKGLLRSNLNFCVQILTSLRTCGTAENTALLLGAVEDSFRAKGKSVAAVTFSIPCVCRGSSPERTATGTTTCPA